MVMIPLGPFCNFSLSNHLAHFTSSSKFWPHHSCGLFCGPHKSVGPSFYSALHGLNFLMSYWSHYNFQGITAPLTDWSRGLQSRNYLRRLLILMPAQMITTGCLSLACKMKVYHKIVTIIS